MEPISDDALVLVAGYLGSRDVVALMRCCRQLSATLGGTDALWRGLLLRDYGVGDAAEMPPSKRQPEDPDFPADNASFRAAWRAWRGAFHGYDAALVRRFRTFWAGAREVFGREAPRVLDFLAPGATERKINGLEVALRRHGAGRRLPDVLRVHLRFVDGQDRGSGGRHSYAVGLPGAYWFYDQLVVGMLLSSDEMTLFTEQALRGDSGVQSFRSHCPVVFYAGGHRFQMVEDAGEGGALGGNVSCHVLAPGVAARPSHPPSAAGDGLLVWLEQYLWRLRAGVFRFEQAPPHFDMDARIVSLFPRPPTDSPVPAEAAVYLDGQVTSRVTRGVRVDCSALMVPEQLAGGETLYAYSIRFEMLADHPSRPARLAQAQLATRHWRIKTTDPRTGRQNVESVDGDGVVGLYPIVSTAADAEPITYQSCSTASDDANTAMGGFFVFVEGTRDAQTGPAFDVAVEPFLLKAPAFLY
uniref:ApaG domain-containing protein n=1 Tax=Phaeomonas parva TaxID=124430 RepID=A0A7S1Y0Y0_9STRA|mmetsp:Transcript_9436/g.27727  ORF Transcript_9436/g.27727 Transcript_9436/m.27727 type:complete len:470 (+) Transcript_9436:164-1573(+)|eukprot:CAMPEP_0118861422 /NCGR_PEP_ID=MMETSP1163-20130328/6954_1 /TAXON_ID=124430 /ORGANISM="Phaeomonas parva, Strain CCMP2877" /LENGTH=469 /DNA_ID=CAMNT_0006795231 /DNA_START=110 /DNA_END=1519 /DNA_ORIENTATION=-